MFYLLKIKKSVCATILSESPGMQVAPGDAISNKTHLFIFQAHDLVRSQVPLISLVSWLQLPTISRGRLMRKTQVQ